MGNSYIQGSRLRNIRTRKRIAKTDYEKYLRECSDRHSELEKQKWNLPLVPLEKPYQKGYVRFFVVRDDVKRSGLGEFFENLLTKINTYQYADNRKFQKKEKTQRQTHLCAKKTGIVIIQTKGMGVRDREGQTCRGGA